MKTSSEIDEDRADLFYEEGDKVLRVHSEDPLFPVGAYAKMTSPHIERQGFLKVRL